MTSNIKAANRLLSTNPLPVLWGLVIAMIIFFAAIALGSWLGTTRISVDEAQPVNYVSEPVDVNRAVDSCGLTISNR
jgi:hypothetical protein